MPESQNIKRVKNILTQGEGIRLEFKKSHTQLPGNLFESICAMLNRDGGNILLGADNDGNIIGVDATKIETITTNLVNLSNNPEKLDPPFILFPQVYNIDNKTIIHIQVPCSSQLHKSAGVVYDRSNDGDFKVTEPHQIAEIYNRKRTHYTEGIIYPKNPVIAKFFMQLGRVDELGSGVINVNKFIKKYSGQSNPTFIEGKTFKMTIPLANEGTIEGVKQKLIELITLLIKEEGNRKPYYSEVLNESEKNLERYLKILAPFIEFKGAPKTGGYYLTKSLKEKLKVIE